MRKRTALLVAIVFLSGATPIQTPIPTVVTTPTAISTPTLTPARTSQALPAKMWVTPTLLHYGDTLYVKVSAPGASKVILTANIDDPPFIPMFYDDREKLFHVDYPIPIDGMEVEEGEYMFRAIIYYPDGHKVKLRKKVWFEDTRSHTTSRDTGSVKDRKR